MSSVVISEPSRSFVAGKVQVLLNVLSVLQWRKPSVVYQLPAWRPASQRYMMYLEKCTWSVYITYGKYSMSHIWVFKEMGWFSEKNGLFSYFTFTTVRLYYMSLGHGRQKNGGTTYTFQHSGTYILGSFNLDIFFVVLQHAQIRLNLGCQLPQWWTEMEGSDLRNLYFESQAYGGCFTWNFTGCNNGEWNMENHTWVLQCFSKKETCITFGQFYLPEQVL